MVLQVKEKVFVSNLKYQKTRSQGLKAHLICLSALQEQTPPYLSVWDIKEVGGPLLGGDPTLPLCMRYQRSRGPLLGGDPSLPLYMRYQGIKGSALGRGPLEPLWEGTPYALVCIYSGGDPSLPLCMRYQGSRGSTNQMCHKSLIHSEPLIGSERSHDFWERIP